MRFSITANALSPDLRVAITQSRTLGFDGVVLDAFSTSLDLTTLSGTGRRELRHVLETYSQRLVALQVDVGSRGFSVGVDLDRLLERFDAVLQTAAELAANVVTVELGTLFEPAEEAATPPAITSEQAGLIFIPAPKPAAPVAPVLQNPPPDPAFVAQVDSAMSAIGALADRYRMTLAFSSALSSFAALQRAVNGARCPWFGIDLDPAAMLRDRWSRDQIFSRLAPLIRHVRGRDAALGSDRRTRPAVIGTGSVDWNALFAALDQSDFRGAITIDPIELSDRVAAASAGLDTLQKIAR